MQLALTHDAKGSTRDSVNGDIECDAALALLARKLDSAKRHVTLLTKVFPGGHRLICDRREALVPNVGGSVLQPCLGQFDARKVLRTCERCSGAPDPVGDRGGNGPPSILSALQLRGRCLLE